MKVGEERFLYTDEQYKKLLIDLHGIKAGTEGFELWLKEKVKLTKIDS